MIRKIKATNFQSFYEPVEIDLVAKRAISTPDLYQIGEKESVTKVLGIIGPNASGKTTLLKIPAFLAWFISRSFFDIPVVGGSVPVYGHFAHPDEPSEFELEFDYDGSTWKYELQILNFQVTREKLSKKHERWNLIFQREFISGSNTFVVKSKNFKLPKREAAAVRGNISLIAAAAQFGEPTAVAVATYFQLFTRTNVRVDGRVPKEPALNESINLFASNQDIAANSNSILKNWDLGLERIEIRDTQNDPKLPERIVEGVHNVNGKEYRLNIAFESGGTQAALILMSQILPMLKVGGVAIIDELEHELHPDLLNEILNLFGNIETNPFSAQLLFTTHASEIINSLDKNQVYLVEKNEECESIGFCLAEIKGARSDLNQYLKYRGGAYGAVPNLN